MRAIFALFEEHGSILLTLQEIERRGWRLKSWTRKTGQFRAGGPFAKNSLRRLLTNILYTGAIRHKGQRFEGEHAAILAPGTWERVQILITERTDFPDRGARNQHLALLSGLLYCPTASLVRESMRTRRADPGAASSPAVNEVWARAATSNRTACVDTMKMSPLSIPYFSFSPSFAATRTSNGRSIFREPIRVECACPRSIPTSSKARPHSTRRRRGLVADKFGSPNGTRTHSLSVNSRPESNQRGA